MAKKRLVLKRNETDRPENLYKVFAVQFPVPVYKFIFDLNRLLQTDLFLNQNKLEKIENHIKIKFNNYASIEEHYEPLRIFQNRIKIITQNSNELFATEQNYYLLPKFKEASVLIFAPVLHPFIEQKINFNPGYFNFWQELKPNQINPYPIFPDIALYQ